MLGIDNKCDRFVSSVADYVRLYLNSGNFKSDENRYMATACQGINPI